MTSTISMTSTQIRARARRRALGALLTATAAALTACGGSTASGGSSTSPGSSAAGSSKVVVGVPPAISGEIVGFAEAQGYFEGIEVSTKDLNGGAASIPALQGGAIQIAQSNVLSVVQGAQQGLDVPCFAGAFQFRGEAANYLPLVVGQGAAVTSVAGLTGKTVAVNAAKGVNEVAASAYLKSQGVDPTTVRFVAMPFPNMPQALAAGQVDAAVTVEPFASMIEGSGGTVLAKNVAGAVEGQPLFACWVATGDYLKNDPQAVKSFVAGVDQAGQKIKDDPQAFSDYLAKNTDVPASIASSAPDFTTEMSAKDVDDWTSAAKDLKVLSGSAPDGSKTYSPVEG